jgi:tRNA pseudouridine38-40 synthase
MHYAHRLNFLSRSATMPRYKLTIEYDGTPFCGWQRQADKPSVQEVLERACAQFAGLDNARLPVQCSGRTDAGVHAYGQVVHVDFPQSRDPYNIVQGLNVIMLPNPVVVVCAEAVEDSFHARFDSKERHYEYRIINRPAMLALERDRAWHVHTPLDVARMNEGAQHLLGHHDFTSFRASGCQSKSPEKSLDILQVTRDGERVYITAKSRSFLHHQVRNMVGTLMYVGNGKWDPDDVKRALYARDRRAAGPTAPAHGLYFMGVTY